jgi:hypothetical protein
LIADNGLANNSHFARVMSTVNTCQLIATRTIPVGRQPIAAALTDDGARLSGMSKSRL